MPPPLTPDEARRLADLERWRKDHEAQHMREREEIRVEVRSVTDATVRHVERTIAEGLRPLTEVDRRFGVIEAQNAAQTTILHQQNDVLAETRDELVANRIEREKRAAADEAKAKLEKEAKDQREADLAAKGERTKRLAVYATIIVAIVGLLGALVTAAIASHK